MAEEDVKSKGLDLARYAILNEYSGRPVRRDDLKKADIPMGRQFAKILAQSNRELNSTFGLELVEVRPRGFNAEKVALEAEKQRKEAKRKRKSNPQGDEDDDEEGGDGENELGGKAKGGNWGSKQFILRSSLDSDLIYKLGEIVNQEIPLDDRGCSWSQEENDVLDWKRGDELSYQGVLGFILSLILTHNRSIEDKELRNYLKRLRINDDWAPPHNPSLLKPMPSIDVLLDHFVKLKYLESTEAGGKASGGQAAKRRQSQAHRVVNDAADQKPVWTWGPRAEIEIGEKGIAKFIASIYKETWAQNSQARNNDSVSISIGRNTEFSEKKMLSDIERAAGSELQDANRLEAYHGQADEEE